MEVREHKVKGESDGRCTVSDPFLKLSIEYTTQNLHKSVIYENLIILLGLFGT